ncbi:hypothetical protein EVAR_27809_1 [Eumeta japonica]|uniref:Uncharacterized protein n=1 Tax=Eumeta variegata TaxID=151549 RepID=A0A4C1VJ62_EUMVA|nr:hypothetical protein EVAR_27809_1 [Eumeta japonica]
MVDLPHINDGSNFGTESRRGSHAIRRRSASAAGATSRRYLRPRQSTIRSDGRAGRGGPLARSHVNNYRRGSNYKAPRSADMFSSCVRAGRDGSLGPADGGAPSRPNDLTDLLSLS